MPGWLDGVVGGSEAESEAWNEERCKVKFLINRALTVSGCLVFQYPEIHKTLINKRLTLLKKLPLVAIGDISPCNISVKKHTLPKSGLKRILSASLRALPRYNKHTLSDRLSAGCEQQIFCLVG